MTSTINRLTAEIERREREFSKPAPTGLTAIIIRTHDARWIAESGYASEPDAVDGGTQWYRVTVPVSRFNNINTVTFCGRDMVRGTITGRAPRGHQPAVMYPISYAVIGA